MGTVAGPPDPGESYVSPPELAIVRAMLADAWAGRPRCVLIQGERGIGKTAFLRELSADLDSTRVVPTCGEASETQLQYGLLEHLTRLTGEVLPEELAVLCIPNKAEPGPFVVGNALLRFLVTLQQSTPVLLVIDDADLADTSSQLALLFALRRLHDSRILTVFAACDPGRLIEGLQKLVAGEHGATITLRGLAHDGVMRLAASLEGRRPPVRFVERLSKHTGGNPSHIRSVIEALGAHGTAHGTAEIGDDPLPVPPPILSLVFRQLTDCAPAGRKLAAAAAVLGERCPLELVRRVAGIDDPLHSLQAAIDAGLVEYRKRDVVFAHPLTRAAVYHHLDVPEKADLHRRAARLVTEEGARLGHLAAAAVDRDEELAGAIADFAARTAAGGSWLRASALYVDSAELIFPGPAREAYVLEAVECLLAAGDTAGAALVAGRFDESGCGPRMLVVRGRLARIAGKSEEAEKLLVRARDAGDTQSAADVGLQARIANELARVSVDLLRPAEAALRADAAVRVTAGLVSGPGPELAWSLALAGRTPDATSLFDVLEPSIDESKPADAGLLLGRVVADLFSGALREARERAALQVRIADRFGRLPLRLGGLAMLSLAEYRLGFWSEATTHADQGAAIAEAAGPGNPRGMLHLAALLPLAGRGMWEAAEAHEAQAATAATNPFEQALAWMGSAVLAHARGWHGKVIDAVASLREVGEGGAIDEPGGPWPWQELQVDALIGMGRLDEAEEVLRQFELLAESRRSLAAAAAAARLRACLEAARGREQQAQLAFARAKHLGAQVPMPFDRARTHVECGAFLRRAGKRTAAVAELRAARECFDRLGARPYVARCDRELAAAGLHPQRRRPGIAAELTPQERSVAELVAEGKSNRVVARELVVSVNTVEYHLKNIYAKLGISSRTQLTLHLRVAADAAQGSIAN